MTPEQGIKTLRRRLGGRGVSNQLQSHLIDALNEAQEELESGPVYPYFLEAYSSGIVPATTFNGFSAPADFIIEHEERPVVWTSDDGATVIALTKRLFQELEQHRGADGTAPYFYALVGGTDFYTFPYIQTGTYSLRYYAHMALIDEDNLNTINKWWRFCPFLLIAKAGFIYAANTLKDPELTQVFQKQLADAELQLLALNTQQSMAGFDASAQFLQPDE